MKVALIGVGRWGTILKGELEKQVEVKYACDSKADLNQVFADPEVEAVFIATPTETHFEIAEQALNAGKHVFVEKPATDSSEKLAKLVELAETKKLTLAVGYEFPHHPAARKLKELIGNTAIDVIFCDWRKWGTFKDDARKHLLCHDVSLLKFFGLDPTPYGANATKVISDTDILGIVYAKGFSIISRVSPIKNKSVTISAGDSVYAWNNDELSKVNKETQMLEKIDLPPGTAVGNEIADFLSAIRDRREPLSNGRFALEVYKAIERA